MPEKAREDKKKKRNQLLNQTPNQDRLEVQFSS